MASPTGDIDIDYVARLARLQLGDAERETYSRQLGTVLDYFEKLAAVDVEGVEPTAHAMEVVNVFEEDEPRPTLSQADFLRNAPASRDGQVVVPKVVDEG